MKGYACVLSSGKVQNYMDYIGRNYLSITMFAMPRADLLAICSWVANMELSYVKFMG